MDIDISKENIQPLRGGRNLAQLGTALQAQSDVDAQKQLQLQKEEHETAIRLYQGSDPLDPWFNYIQWVEQCYPKHGHEGHMDKLIKECLQTFETDERYFQDRRLVKLWIKYIDCLSNPSEIYQMLHGKGIGVECSEFYRAWACYCEESGDYKKANQVYMLGLQARAQPLDELEQAHMNFQLFFAQRMLHDDSPTKRKAASALAETRMALTSLKSFKRRNIANVPVQRVGDSVRSFGPGVVRQQPDNENRPPSSNVMVNVYEDAPSTSHAMAPIGEEAGPVSLVQACANVENEREVGVWTNPKTKMVQSHIVPHQPLPFEPYEDDNDVLRLSSKHQPHCVDDLTFNVPLCVPDPPDPTKISCYNKSQVYVNDQEYSLEEVRSRKYNLERTKTETNQQIVEEPKYNINETLAQCSALETLANCALDSEQEHIDKENKVSPSRLQNIENAPIAAQPVNKNNLMEEFNRSLMGNLLSDSVTVNTKEARWELRNIFNDNEPSFVQPVPVPQVDMQQFDIHEDRSITMAINSKKKQWVVDVKTMEVDKENANECAPVTVAPPAQENKTVYYEEPSCTQIFNFNIKDASTPNMSQFKKPISIDQSKLSSVPKFSIDESGIEHLDHGVKRDEWSRRQSTDQHATVDHQAAGLSVIMEATREYNSKSGSSGSSTQSRTNFTAYTTNYDSMYNNHNDPVQPTTSKRSSISAQPRLANGQFSRAYPQKREQEKAAPSPAVPYLSHDHQYQKPAQNYAYSPQRTPQSMFQQQNYAYQNGYPNNQMMNQQQQMYEAQSPNVYQSPQLNKISPVPVPKPQSPQYQQGYGYSNGYPNNQAINHQQQMYGSPSNVNQNAYHMQQNKITPQAKAQTPPYQQNYAYQNQNGYPPNQMYNQQQVYASPNAYRSPQYNVSAQKPQTPQTPQQYQQNYAYQNEYPNAQMINQQQQQQQQHPQAQHQTPQHANQQQIQQHQNQQLQQQQNHQQQQQQNQPHQQQQNQQYQQQPQPQQQQQQQQAYASANTNTFSPQPNKISPPAKTTQNQTPHKSPTSALRNVRHEQSNAKIGQNSPDVDFTYLCIQTGTPHQAVKVSQIVDKQKDISKRQLDFEQRPELLSEDSRDSISKESRISSVCSRQSDFQSDGYGMDVDSENSMEAGAFKSMHSISLVETSDIRRPADIEFPKVIDPFNKKLLKSLLEYVKFPNKTHAEGYNEVRSIPKLQLATIVGVGNNKFSVEKQLGKGNYGAVFLCLDLHSNKSVAVKYQKPSRPWEFYICQEIKARIKDPFMLPGYMDITTAFLGENASLFVSEYSKYGSLLDVANKVKIATSKCINEFVVILLTSEMLSIVHYLHKAQIIHADIKPDNFLLMQIPTQEWRTPSLQLIDLGCSIDMSLFPQGTTFRELIATEGFTCTEMREGKPWTYQTDLYCLAGTIHVILMGSYMKVANRAGQWNIDKKLPRYMKVHLWDKVFTTLLNVPSCDTLPDLVQLKSEVDRVLNEMDSPAALRNFANVLKSR